MNEPSTHPTRSRVHDPLRLAELRATDLLDAPPDPEIDLLTGMAARALAAPGAVVSLVDADRQFFAACVGLPRALAARRETPLEHTFCQHVVAHDATLAVRDASLDPRFAANPAVREHGIRAYAGHPIRTRGGLPIGALGVVDTRARQWRAEDFVMLEDFARILVTQLELRHEVKSRRALEATLADERERYRLLYDRTPGMLHTVDAEGRIVHVSDRWLEVFGYSREEVIGRGIADFMSESSRRDAVDHFATLMVEHRAADVPYRFVTRSGSVIDTAVSSIGEADERGRIRCWLSVTVDVTERNRLLAELRREAARDPLTGALNRVYFFEELAESVRAAPVAERPLSVAVMDIDYLKNVNDRYGRRAGDAALVALTAIAHESLGANEVIARLGGEEFAILLPGSEAASAHTLCERLRKAIRLHPIFFEAHRFFMTASIGIAELRPEWGPAELLRHAESALGEAKRLGRDRVVLDRA